MKFSEHYVVARTEIVVANINGEDHHIRVEALDDQKGSFSTRAYILRSVKVGYEFPIPSDGLYADMWLDFDLPWTHRDTAEGAIKQALSFLFERTGS
ncbi:hypothetical protein [Aliirhizobium cellulosilyticum]|uniref:Uncharacterized protein n=1 Tax=Aliirhizobium cellulosilyticum TaxID=393664 RepID=A0A7W6TBN9_9HYPH|nr:hypothetical protein [Rhizobium cellulosilyticum]MBB4347963.1 hypothetical protein [Rhizobium cellulosilyticum]MBB4409643.1 hypothetical protein [Rhizobium cellulosilyticum]MBB4444330.1 hypothetical protein [Rhizobium cellulosilyticum]